jgi:hypothetical protein
MTRAQSLASLAVGAAFAIVSQSPAYALPTMVRLGYTNCATCHLSPQGGGPLNDYGRGIDQAQSLRGGEYRPSDDGLFDAMGLRGRITQDLRLVMHEQGKWSTGQSAINTFRPRLMYRNVTALGSSFRLAGTVTWEGASATRPSLRYDPPSSASNLFVNTVLLHYRASETIEFAAGADQLPTGVNVPDLGAFIKARNRLGYYDVPTQIKMFWGGKRYQITPFLYAPHGTEPTGEREAGGGSLAEFDLMGTQRTVVGATIQHGTASRGNRRLVGGYARLGFGRWGILAEHDVTSRTRKDSLPMSFRQDATYAQVFWAMRDWLVMSGTGERLHVGGPYKEHLTAGKLEVAARLASQATLSFGTRIDRNMTTGRLSKSLTVQAAFKTVH